MKPIPPSETTAQPPTWVGHAATQVSRFKSWMWSDPSLPAPITKEKNLPDPQTLLQIIDPGAQPISLSGRKRKVWKIIWPDGQKAYFKIYSYRHLPWRYLARASHAAVELANYSHFARWNIPHPAPLLAGEWRSRFNLISAVLVTGAIEPSTTLEQWLLDAGPQNHPHWIPSILEQLADCAARAHARRFCHRTLNLRNVLIQPGPAPTDPPRLYWIDCPSGGFTSLWPRRDAMRDLACMAKVARPGFGPEGWRKLLEIYCARRNWPGQEDSIDRTITQWLSERPKNYSELPRRKNN